ncbi:MAG TPA: HAD family hydrolase [Patescibacteria group bacterium]|nr:HAD family hydrolase [Patescibacteria group bacterium]
MIKAVLLDMDNTLLATQELFEEAHGKLAAFLKKTSGTPESDTLVTVRRFEVELFSSFGYGTGMLPQAFENTLLSYHPRAALADIAAVRAMADEVYTREAKVIPGVEAALRGMAAHLPLYIVTAGEQAVQQRRIDAMPFKDVFTETFAVPEKTSATYTAMLRRLGLAPHEVVMIGDSLKSDIIPATEAGLIAIHIPHMNWFGREMAGLAMPENKGAMSCKTMAEAARAVITGATAAPAPPAFAWPKPPFAYRPPAAA